MLNNTGFSTTNTLKILFFLVLSVFSICHDAHAEWVEWLLDSETSLILEDNINHAVISDQKHSDQFWSTNISGGRAYQLSDYTRAYASVNFSSDVHNIYNRLDRYTLGGRLILSYKFGLGIEQPILQFKLTGNRVFSASHLRNGNIMLAGLQLTKRFGERVQLFGGYNFDYFKATNNNSNPQAVNNANSNLDNVESSFETQQVIASKSSSVFDIQGHSINAGLSFLLTQQLQLSAGYTWRYGDVVSNIQSPDFNNSVEYLPLLQKISAVSTDDAFSGWSYRTTGVTNNFDVSMGYSFCSGHAAVNVAYRNSNTHTAGSAYLNNIIQMDLSYSY